jgi:diguanylate cyclase (GGDEF)-like protein
MALGPRDQQQPLFGRESLFRKKLNQLRTSGHIDNFPSTDSVSRTREIETSAYLEQAHASLSNTDPVELDRLTLLDNTTELYNHKTITRVLKDELKRSKRYKYNTAIVSLRIDGFEEIVGKFGHFASDSVLKGAANFLMATIRDVDIPARYDSETFVVVCPQTDISGASVLAERLRNKIFTERISDVGQNWSVTISIGISAYPSGGAKEDELFASSMEALREAQRRGGNSYAIWEPETASN